MVTKHPCPCFGRGRQQPDREINHRTVANYGAISIPTSSLTKSTPFSSRNQSLSRFSSKEKHGRVGHDDNNLRRADGRHETESLLDCTALEFQETIEQYEQRIWHKAKGEKMRQIGKSALIGGLVGGCIALLGLLAIAIEGSDWWRTLQYSQRQCFSQTCSAMRGQQQTVVVNGIQTYLDLFDWRRQRRDVTGSKSNRPRRKLAADIQTSSSGQNPTLVVAGKMSIAGGPCNIAQYSLKTREWGLDERIQLSLYNSYSGGEVYSLLANHTTYPAIDSAWHSELIGQHHGSGELIVVGAFDTTYRSSQVTYCSVGRWDGVQLSKVGEGLCNSALSKGMKITTAALAGPQDVYVAGSFQTQVWNGDRHEFVQIFNIAHFNAVDQVWLPLNVGQISCSWCTVTVLALAWDNKRRQLHIAGKFNSIDGRNVPAGLAIYDYDSGHLVAHPGGGLSMQNISQDGVGTALQLDEESGVLYVMGSFERLTQTYERCDGLAAYEIETNIWSCLADARHSVEPTGGGNMLLTPYGLMVAGMTGDSTTWTNPDRPYTIALLNVTLKTRLTETQSDDESLVMTKQNYHSFNWSWLPGFHGHDEPLHALSNGFGSYEGSVFIAGDDLVARWSLQPVSSSSTSDTDGDSSSADKENENTPDFSRRVLIDARVTSTPPRLVPTTELLSDSTVRGAIMALSQMEPESDDTDGIASSISSVNIQIIVYCVTAGCIIGVIGAIMFNRNITGGLFPFTNRNKDFKGFTLDTLTYSAVENSNIMEAYNRAMQTRYVHHPNLLTVINPQQIFLQRIIGEGTFGRVWVGQWGLSKVAVKEFVFAQAAVAGKSSMQQQIVEEIIGEAGMMAMLRHPNVLQLFGCSLTAQAIWIVSELCSLGSLRQVLDDNDRVLSVESRLSLALQVAEGMTYLHNQDPPIIHRDLKSHNIFVHEAFIDADDGGSASSKRADGSEKLETRSTLVAKIGDWGSARATLSGSRTMTHGVGTACWLAPECIKYARSSKLSDIYSFGIILWELATREEVYQGLETTQIIAKVANENLRPPVPQDCPWKDIMVKCWAENPLDRLEFSEIVEGFNAIDLELKQGSRLLENDPESS